MRFNSQSRYNWQRLVIHYLDDEVISRRQLTKLTNFEIVAYYVLSCDSSRFMQKVWGLIHHCVYFKLFTQCVIVIVMLECRKHLGFLNVFL